MTIEIKIEDLIKLINTYTGNKHDLNDLRVYLEEDSVLDTGVSEIEETFEQGYNNALEYAFQTLNITDVVENAISELKEHLKYDEEWLKNCGYGKSDLMYIEKIKADLKTLQNFLYNYEEAE